MNATGSIFLPQGRYFMAGIYGSPLPEVFEKKLRKASISLF